MGGRAAEEIIFGEATSGAANDIEKATDIAVKMVAELGMSEKGISNRSYILKQNPEFIYTEVEKIIGDAFAQSRDLLQENRDFLKVLAEYLLEKETIDANEIHSIYQQFQK